MPGQNIAVAATLWDKWAMGPDKFINWTDRQIRDICFHKRDKEGHIVIPENPTFDQPVTPESEWALVQQLKMMLGDSLQGTQEAEAKIKEKMKNKDE